MVSPKTQTIYAHSGATRAHSELGLCRRVYNKYIFGFELVDDSIKSYHSICGSKTIKR